MYQTLLKPAFLDIKNFILDTLFPISCLSCGTEGQFICADCKSVMTKLEHQRCIVCQKATPFGFTHSGCQTPHGADGLISFYDYHDEKVAAIIIKGKYNFIGSTFEILGKIIAKKLKEQYQYLLIPTSYYLTPIPLATSRQRWRGFNQAEILCQTLSQELSLPCISVLVRCKLTKTQKDLKKGDRLSNVAGAFAVIPSFLRRGGREAGGVVGADDSSSIKGKNFILVDDVTTTGATLQEAAKVLKRNGAGKVICLTVARD